MSSKRCARAQPNRYLGGSYHGYNYRTTKTHAADQQDSVGTTALPARSANNRFTTWPTRVARGQLERSRLERHVAAGQPPIAALQPNQAFSRTESHQRN